MKKFTIFAAIAVFVFGACSKYDVKQKDTRAIGFGTYVPTSTKAAAGSVLSGTTFAANAQINVYAWNTGASAFAQSTTAPNFMKNDGASGNSSVVTLSGTPASVPSSNYTPVKFWPSDEANNKLSFIGFYPADAAPGYTLTWTTSGDVVNGSITVPAASASQIDFMVSDVVNDKTYSNTTAGGGTAGNVPLKFNHLMTQINVKVKTDAATDAFLGAASNAPTLTVSALSFTTIKNKGKLTTTYNTGTSTHVMAADGATTETYVFSPSSPLNLKNTSTAAKYLPGGGATAAIGDAYLLVPQALAAGAQKVSVTYRIDYTDGTFSTQTVTKDLYDGSVKTWGQNQKIVYTFVIGLKPITFTSDLVDWTTVEADPFNF